MRAMWTTRQIVQKIGRPAICKLLRVGKDAPRKWYSKGIPGRHWERLIDTHGDWLTYDQLAHANKIARLPPRRRNGG